ncbi:hypothetical protein ACQPYE_26350 [Actinosynnema sp. CA-299493]
MKSMLVAAGMAVAALGAVAGTATAAPAAQSVVANQQIAVGSLAEAGWVNTGETFNRLAPCDSRGYWYYANYADVYDWDCRWSSSTKTYRLWIYVI